MPAMHDEVLHHMYDILEAKCSLMLRLKPFSMTHEEVLSLLAPEEDVELLLRASKIAEVYGSMEWMTLEAPVFVDGEGAAGVSFRMRTHNFKRPPLRPVHLNWQLPRHPERAELAERVTDWLYNRYVVGRKFGMAKYVLRELNKVCTHGSQLTYLMPTISHLCRRGLSPRMDTWLDRFGAFKAIKNAPALSLPLRKATGDAAALLTSLALLGDDIPEPELGEVEIKASNMPSIKFEGSWIRRI